VSGSANRQQQLLRVSEPILERAEVGTAGALVLCSQPPDKPVIKLSIHGSHELGYLSARRREEQLSGGFEVPAASNNCERATVVPQPGLQEWMSKAQASQVKQVAGELCGVHAPGRGGWRISLDEDAKGLDDASKISVADPCRFVGR